MTGKNHGNTKAAVLPARKTTPARASLARKTAEI
jgi:hypothetical protein